MSLKSKHPERKRENGLVRESKVNSKWSLRNVENFNRLDAGVGWRGKEKKMESSECWLVGTHKMLMEL